jgi:hypothetical protein
MLARFLLSATILFSMGCATAHSGAVQPASIVPEAEAPDTILDNLRPMVLFSHLRIEEGNKIMRIMKPILYVMVTGDERTTDKKDKH